MSKDKKKDERKEKIEEEKVEPSRQDLRACTRCNICLNAEVRLSNGILLEGQTENISMRGLWFRTEKTFPKNTPVKIHLYLTGTQDKQSLDIKGTVVRIEADGMGIKFDEIDSDSEAYLHLLLMFDSGSSNVSHQEVDKRIGLEKLH